MKIISLYCLLVNLTPSWKKRGCLGKTLSPDVFPVQVSRCNYSRLFLWESDAAPGKHKEVREHPWTLSMRGHWYSNNMQTPFDCAVQRAFQIQHLHATLCPSSSVFSKVKKSVPITSLWFLAKRGKKRVSSFSLHRLVCKLKAVNLDN